MEHMLLDFHAPTKGCSAYKCWSLKDKTHWRLKKTDVGRELHPWNGNRGEKVKMWARV